MNEVQRCKVERIIREVLENNKEKSLNEIKRIVKNKIRIKKGNSKEIEENMQLISEISTELVENVVLAPKSSKNVPMVIVVDSEKKTKNIGR